MKVFDGTYAAGADFPLDRVFAWLRERWLEEDEERTSASLARLLDVSPQQITNWAHRGAPWWGVLRVCEELNLALVVEPARIYAIPTGPQESL